MIEHERACYKLIIRLSPCLPGIAFGCCQAQVAASLGTERRDVTGTGWGVDGHLSGWVCVVELTGSWF